MDTQALAAVIRGVDRASAEAVDRAYARVFSGPDGHLVLMHMVRAAATIAGPHLSAEERTYHQARFDTVLTIAGKAGFDALAIAGALLNGQLEGTSHGGSRNHTRNAVRLDDAIDPDGF